MDWGYGSGLSTFGLVAWHLYRFGLASSFSLDFDPAIRSLFFDYFDADGDIALGNKSITRCLAGLSEQSGLVVVPNNALVVNGQGWLAARSFASRRASVGFSGF